MDTQTGLLRLLFLVRSLNCGGAERQLVQLVRGLSRRRFDVTVAVMYPGGALWQETKEIDGIRLICLEKRGRWDLVSLGRRLWSVAREIQPHVIHGYMGVANELSLALGRAYGARVVWGLRAADMDLASYGPVAVRAFKAGAPLSRFADAIIVNSFAGKSHHVAEGYSSKNMIVIPNGIDADRFRPDPAAGQGIRQQWGVAPGERLIGIVARLDPVKDHATFLAAAGVLARERSGVRFVCVGARPEPFRTRLETLAAQLALDRRLIWAGQHQELRGIYNALDIATSSSTSEGFSNVVGEALACGIPCVTTGVGDCASIVDNPECVVPPRKPDALAAAWKKVLDWPDEKKREFGKNARMRMVSEYSLDRLVHRTEAVLLGILEQSRGLASVRNRKSLPEIARMRRPSFAP
jgi:glycosyltransferase involved in cell wall biosynthesis